MSTTALLRWMDAALAAAWKMLAEAERMYARGLFVQGEFLAAQAHRRIEYVAQRIEKG